MAKKVVGFIKLQIQAGKANPAPPIGPALGQKGVNIMDFCKQFNAKTQGKDGVFPTVITVYQDKSFSFITKQPPVSYMLKKALGIKKASSVPNRDKVGKLSHDKIVEIAQNKMQDMNVNDLEAAIKIVKGSARSMGIDCDEA